MADLTTFTTMQPGTVSAYGDILKTITNLNPVVGGIVTLIGAYFVNKSAKKVTTKADATAEAVGASPEDLKTFKSDLEKISKDSLTKFEAAGKVIAERIEASGRDTVHALDQAKIKAMKLSNQADSNLSGVVRVSDALTQRMGRIERNYAEIKARFRK